MKKVLRSRLLVVFILIPLAAGVVTGMIICSDIFKTAPTKDAVEISRDAHSKNNKERIYKENANAHTKIKIFFTLCGHEITKSENSVLTADLYEESPVGEISSDGGNVIFEKVEGFCPKHYVVKATEGSFAIYKRNAETLENEYLMDITKAVGEIDENVFAELKAGISFSSLKEIDQYFEDAGS